jgi:DNA-directed RNA polymerase subunit E'/Rpb7
MEYVAVFEEQLALTSVDLKKNIESIDDVLENKLKQRLEGRCSKHGFVVPDSVKILSRSMGSLERGRFTGDILFHVQAEGTVINPPDGHILQGDIIRKNKMGLYVNYRDAIRVIIPRDVNIGNNEFESVEIGEVVRVEIKKSRFQVNDEYILSVGLFKGRSSKPSKGLLATLNSGAEEEEEEEEEEGVEETAEEEEEEGVEETAEEEDAEEDAEEEVGVNERGRPLNMPALETDTND